MRCQMMFKCFNVSAYFYDAPLRRILPVPSILLSSIMRPFLDASELPRSAFHREGQRYQGLHYNCTFSSCPISSRSAVKSDMPTINYDKDESNSVETSKPSVSITLEVDPHPKGRTPQPSMKALSHQAMLVFSKWMGPRGLRTLLEDQGRYRGGRLALATSTSAPG
jgi:hypothetical protein